MIITITDCQLPLKIYILEEKPCKELALKNTNYPIHCKKYRQIVGPSYRHHSIKHETKSTQLKKSQVSQRH